MRHRTENLDEAERLYRDVIAQDANQVDALHALGVIAAQRKDFATARALLRNALAIDPQNADAHFNLAGLYERRGEKASALRHLKMYKRLTVNR